MASFIESTPHEKASIVGATIIIADDAPEVLAVLRDTLSDDFTLHTATNGEEVCALVDKLASVDAIIMGVHMPKLDGLGVTKLLKSNFTTCHIPIILMTRKTDLTQMITAVELGADDYLLKPLDPETVPTRLSMNLKRAMRDRDVNPLTRLPGNSVIMRMIAERLTEPLAVLYVDLDAFKAYNDHYGFDAGDRVIRATARLCGKIIQAHDPRNGFLGHVGGDDFIMLTTPEHAEPIAQEITQTFDAAITQFYDEEDRKRGGITERNRQGSPLFYPLMSLSIAIISNQHRPIHSIIELAERAAELKRYAKTKPSGRMGSNFVVDHRSN